MTIEEALEIIREEINAPFPEEVDQSKILVATDTIEEELKRIRILHREEQRRSADRLRKYIENTS